MMNGDSMYVSEVKEQAERIGHYIGVDGISTLEEYLKKLEKCDCEILEDAEFLI